MPERRLSLDMAFYGLAAGMSGDVGVGPVNADVDVGFDKIPGVHWQISKRWSLQAGYRWVYNDYKSGSGPSRFTCDMLTHGPQVGLTVHF